LILVHPVYPKYFGKAKASALKFPSLAILLWRRGVARMTGCGVYFCPSLFCLPLEGVPAGGGWIKHKLELYPPPALRATSSQTQTEVWEGLKAPPCLPQAGKGGLPLPSPFTV